MRILTLFLALFLTLLPEGVTYVDFSQTQEACWEDLDTLQEEAVIKTVQREQVQVREASPAISQRFPYCQSDIAVYQQVDFCFERQWHLHCRLRL